MKSKLLLAILAALPALAPGALTPEALQKIQQIGEAQISPDGATIVFTVSTGDVAANKTVTRLMRIDGDSAARVLEGAPDGASSLRWARDSRRLAFIAGAEGKNAIWVLDTGSGKVTRACDFARPNSFLSKAGNSLAWSPDGARLAFTGTTEPEPGPQDPLVITRILYKTRTAFSDNRRSHIFVVDAAGGAPKQLTRGEYDEHSIDWGGDGREIVFLSNRAPDSDARLNYDIFAVDVAGADRQLTRTPGVEMDPKVSPDGKWISYLATKRALTTIDSVAEDAHLWAIPMQGGAGRELNGRLDRRTSSHEWTPDSRSIVHAIGDRGRIALYRIPATGGHAEAIFDDLAQAGPLSIARGTGTVVFGISTLTMPRELFRLASNDAKPQRLTHLNDALMAEWKPVEPEGVAFRSFDKTSVEGWLYRPRDDAGDAPLILSIHGGPHGMFGYGFSAPFQLFASRGYAVLAVNPRGSSGYGQKFSDGCVNDWGGGDYKDLMGAVDYVLTSKRGLDRNRLGVTGASYGGFMTNWVITQTPRFKAAVSVASLSNLISFYATSLYQDLVHAEFNGFPWDGENFATLWKWSPLAHVKRVSTPTLFLHGERDNDVHITQAEEMYTAMRQRGLEAVLVRYPREGHGLREPKHQADSLTRTLAWMDRFLK
ncbi:MAG: S9 family peptidase [Bryobacteraceae bacterium]